MSQFMKNERGITLVELLAVLAIGSMILTLIIGVATNGQKNYISQTNATEQLTEIQYAVKVITKEVRKAERIKVEENKLTINHGTQLVIQWQNGKVQQNDTVLATRIGTLKFAIDERLLSISIATVETNGKKQETKAEIYLRDGVIVDE